MCFKKKKPNKLWEDASQEGEAYSFRVGGAWFTWNPFPEVKLEGCDAKESKKYWYIDYDGGILHSESDNSPAEKMLISLGNHFELLEEAERAVGKLQAFKRLKDRGFRFTGYNACSVDYDIDEQYRKYISEDLNILFSGEDD